MTSDPPSRPTPSRSLSVADLLDAREAYHSHLAHMQNVVATAVGLYRIRQGDPEYDAPPTGGTVPPQLMEAPPRTLANSVVRPWSEPCLLVFVQHWLTRADLAAQDPDQIVPRFLYMPDGRRVRTCTICASPEEREAGLTNVRFPGHLLGGGFPIFTEVQGSEHVASAGCLVTDGDLTYVLTNRHVTGAEPGRELFTMLGGQRLTIGTGSALSLGKRPFAEVYPGWPGERTIAGLDVGLVRLEDLACWTAQVYGIGEIDAPLDLNTDTISLDLIGRPVRAYGAASGPLTGEIQALFYRYRSMGGFDYTADLLIGPREGEHGVATRPGDSGTVWFVDSDVRPGHDGDAAAARAPRLRPAALQWGGHVLLGAEGEQGMPFALATFLSTALRELDIDVVRGWNIGHGEYWGKLGHYKIAATALSLVDDPRLKTFLEANLDRIAFPDDAIAAGNLQPTDGFVPLADVADIVWRNSRPTDEFNHFADMDQPGQGEFEDKTLLDLFADDPENLAVDVWNRFYDAIGATKRGALPFRVWQMYRDMVARLAAGDTTGFLCVGGLMSHYVGDACQPLHVSMFHHGRPGHSEESPVHAKYETEMLDRFAVEIVTRTNTALEGQVAASDLNGGKAAARSVVEMMRDSLAALPPIEIIQAFVESSGQQRLPHMFEVLGDRTVARLAAGSLALARLWSSAWAEGGGADTPDAALGAIETTELRLLYTNADFAPSFRLDDPAFAATLS
jgi:hypothetical protein